MLARLPRRRADVWSRSAGKVEPLGTDREMDQEGVWVSGLGNGRHTWQGSGMMQRVRALDEYRLQGTRGVVCSRDEAPKRVSADLERQRIREMWWRLGVWGQRRRRGSESEKGGHAEL